MNRSALVAAGLVSGVLAALVIGRFAEFFPVIEPDEVKGTQGIYTPEQRALVRAAHVSADYRNVPLTFAVVGLVVAALIGGVAAITSQPKRSASKAVGMGAALGLILGGLGGVTAVFLRQQLIGWNLLAATGEPDPIKLQLHTMLMHLPSWLGVVLAVGFAVGLSAHSGREAARIAGLGVISIVLASLLYPFLAAIALTEADPDVLIPFGTTNRMLWCLLNCGLIGTMIGLPSTSSRSAGT